MPDASIPQPVSEGLAKKPRAESVEPSKGRKDERKQLFS
jgi:hypothetical protein